MIIQFNHYCFLINILCIYYNLSLKLIHLRFHDQVLKSLSHHTQPDVVSAVRASWLVLKPNFDAFPVENMLACRQHNALSFSLELYQADGASSGDSWIGFQDFFIRLLHGENLIELASLNGLG